MILIISGRLRRQGVGFVELVEKRRGSKLTLSRTEAEVEVDWPALLTGAVPP